MEAAIRNGSLDVGIFGPKERINPVEANHLLDKLRRQLQHVVQ